MLGMDSLHKIYCTYKQQYFTIGHVRAAQLTLLTFLKEILIISLSLERYPLKETATSQSLNIDSVTILLSLHTANTSQD